jgi:hypothetical protein
MRLPKRLVRPLDETSPEYQAYLRRLEARLSRNRHLKGADPSGIAVALRTLDAKADEVIKTTASTVFVSTAVSQNGRLDALMVLTAQTRLVWRVAGIYNQRPTIGEFGKLYANVGATLFAASSLEDLDVYQQVEPVINAALGGTVAGMVPGFAPVASLLMNSMFDGTANAYLTLRVGAICKHYCRGVGVTDRRGIRRLASVEAAALLGSIVSGSAGVVAKSMKRAAQSSMESAFGRIRGAGARLNPFRYPRGPSGDPAL